MKCALLSTVLVLSLLASTAAGEPPAPATLRTLAELEGHERLVRTAAFRPDGAGFATAGSDRSLRLWSRDGEARASVVLPRGG